MAALEDVNHNKLCSDEHNKFCLFDIDKITHIKYLRSTTSKKSKNLIENILAVGLKNEYNFNVICNFVEYIQDNDKKVYIIDHRNIHETLYQKCLEKKQTEFECTNNHIMPTILKFINEKCSEGHHVILIYKQDKFDNLDDFGEMLRKYETYVHLKTKFHFICHEYITETPESSSYDDFVFWVIAMCIYKLFTHFNIVNNLILLTNDKQSIYESSDTNKERFKNLFKFTEKFGNTEKTGKIINLNKLNYKSNNYDTNKISYNMFTSYECNNIDRYLYVFKELTTYFELNSDEFLEKYDNNDTIRNEIYVKQYRFSNNLHTTMYNYLKKGGNIDVNALQYNSKLNKYEEIYVLPYMFYSYIKLIQCNTHGDESINGFCNYSYDIDDQNYSYDIDDQNKNTFTYGSNKYVSQFKTGKKKYNNGYSDHVVSSSATEQAKLKTLFEEAKQAEIEQNRLVEEAKQAEEVKQAKLKQSEKSYASNSSPYASNSSSYASKPIPSPYTSNSTPYTSKPKSTPYASNSNPYASNSNPKPISNPYSSKPISSPYASKPIPSPYASIKQTEQSEQDEQAGNFIDPNLSTNTFRPFKNETQFQEDIKIQDQIRRDKEEQEIIRRQKEFAKQQKNRERKRERKEYRETLKINREQQKQKEQQKQENMNGPMKSFESMGFDSDSDDEL